jgi:hypothetical protein
MRQHREPFNPAGPFVAGRSFIMSGVSYNHGDPVPVDGLERRRVIQMYEHRMLQVQPAGQGAAAPTPAPARVKEARATVAPPKVKSPATAAPVATVPPSGPVLTTKHQGFGRYVVMLGDQVVDGPMPQRDAQAALAERQRAAAAE